MKSLSFFTGFILFTYAALSQKDTSHQTRPLTINKNAATKINPVTTQKINAVQLTMNQIEQKLNELQALVDKLKDQKDSLSDMNEQDQMKLQQAMDKKN